MSQTRRSGQSHLLTWGRRSVCACPTRALFRSCWIFEEPDDAPGAGRTPKAFLWEGWSVSTRIFDLIAADRAVLPLLFNPASIRTM